MTIARHHPLNIPRAWNWDDASRHYRGLGYDPGSYLKYSSTPAPEPAEGNNIGFLLGGRVGSYRLGAVEVFTPFLDALSSTLPALPTASASSTSTSFLVLMDASTRNARYVLDDEPMLTIKAEDGVVLWGSSVEPNGAPIVTRGMTYAKDLPVITAADLDRLVAAIKAAGGERDNAPDESPLIDPKWPVEVAVEMLDLMVRKLRRRLDALEADDAPDARPRRVNPLPDAVN